MELFKRWYGRENPETRQRLMDDGFLKKMFASVLEAERAVLYTVGFDFNVDLPHTQIASLLRLPRFDYLKVNTEFQQLAVNICNDIMRRDGTLVLQYSCRDIAIAVYYFIFKAAKRENASKIPQPESEPDDAPWYVKEGLDLHCCQEIINRISKLYKVGGQGAASSQLAASAATTMVPASSAAKVSESMVAEQASPVAQQELEAAGPRDGQSSVPTCRNPSGKHSGGTQCHMSADTGPRTVPSSVALPPNKDVLVVNQLDGHATTPAILSGVVETEEGELEEGELPN